MSEANYYRLFPELEAWNPGVGSTPARLDLLKRLAISARRSRTSPGPGNSGIPSGYTYFAQYLNHDLGFTQGGGQRGPIRVEELRNARTPRLDLDSLYGGGPRMDPHLYQTPRVAGEPMAEMAIGENEVGEMDVPRQRPQSAASDNAIERRWPALLADPRNDQTLLISQLHLAFIRFHNREVARIRREDALAGTRPGGLFERARASVVRHFQWLIVEDYLPRLCGAVLPRRVTDFAVIDPQASGLPIEFSFAAFRFGHATARDAYQLNARMITPLRLFRARSYKHYLTGGRSLPPGWSVQWDRFVDVPGSSPPQLSMPIGMSVADSLYWLDPKGGSGAWGTWLPLITLVQGDRVGLPSGQAVATAMGLTPLPGNDPLWIYILKEAEAQQKDFGSSLEINSKLGAVGSAIVGEVIMSRVLMDPTSYLRTAPLWRPRAPDSYPEGRGYDLAAFLDQAGMPMTESQLHDPGGR